MVCGTQHLSSRTFKEFALLLPMHDRFSLRRTDRLFCPQISITVNMTPITSARSTLGREREEESIAEE
jgi:hypothetical protein